MKQQPTDGSQGSEASSEKAKLSWFGTFLGVAALGCICVSPLPNGTSRVNTASMQLTKSAEQYVQTSHPRTHFGQFAPNTDAERELDNMLSKQDGAIDLALANWLIVADLPQFGDMTRKIYFARLNGMVARVLEEIRHLRQLREMKGEGVNNPGFRCAAFCKAVIKLRFDYAEEFRQHELTAEQDRHLHGDANNVFFAGLLRTRRGSCISMPLVYLVIGQQLGFPVHLVAIGKHYFIRWEEPGYRINIETTAVDKVWVTDDDAAYFEEEGLSREQLTGSDLRNLSNREVIGQLFFTRAAYWAMSSGNFRLRNWMDLSRAAHLAPDDPAIRVTCRAVFARYGITPEDTLSSLQQKERNGI